MLGSTKEEQAIQVNSFSFLLYTVFDIFFRMLSLAISSIFDTVWQKKLLAFVPFLEVVLQKLLSSLFPYSKTTSSSCPVFLVDSSMIRQQGVNLPQQQIYLYYNLSENHIEKVQASDVHIRKNLCHVSLKEGNIFLTDAGYVILIISLEVEYEKEKILSLY